LMIDECPVERRGAFFGGVLMTDCLVRACKKFVKIRNKFEVKQLLPQRL